MTAEIVPGAALGAPFTDWSAVTMPVFVAMMFGATLGGNTTLVGVAANIVGAGACSRHGTLWYRLPGVPGAASVRVWASMSGGRGPTKGAHAAGAC